MNASFLRRCALISKPKQHTCGTFGHINQVAGQTISPSSSVQNACSGLNLSNGTNAKINLTQNNIIQVYNN